MRGKKARQIRHLTKSQLPPALRQERSARIGVIAAARNEVLAEAKAEFEVSVAALRSAQRAKMNDAWSEFREKRDNIRADINEKADKLALDALAESA